jgi:hypothetical protein
MDVEVEEPQEVVSTDKLIEAYVRIRDSRTEAKQVFESSDEEFAKQLKVLELELLNICKAQGADSIKTKAGTAIRTIKSKYWTGDWESMYAFIRKNDAFLLLEKRLHQTNMRQFLDENPDQKPAGLNIDSEYAVTVRRSKN